MKYNCRIAARRDSFIFIFALLLSGCGNNKEGEKPSDAKPAAQETPASTPKGACQLLTSEDASSVLEGPVTAGMNTASMCQYLSASDELSKTGESVTLTIHVNG